MLKTLIKNNYKHPEEQYINLIKDLLNENNLEESRSGKTYCNIGAAMYFSLENNCIPILTTKRVAVKTCLKELLWFINGHTDNTLLKKENVHIWDGNASKEFLRSRNLEYREDDLGPVYGHQWRHFDAEYFGCDHDYVNCGIDQLQNVINDLKNPETRYSRRHVITAWNPKQIDEMALPPCHVMFQFHVTRKNKLSCTLYQRSGDVGLGVPFNILSYSALTHLIAKHCNLEPYEFIYYLGNVHVYDQHVDALSEQIKRKPYDFPRINIKKKRQNINEYEIDDFEIIDYNYCGPIKMNMNI
jgi:thymidylate synthase